MIRPGYLLVLPVVVLLVAIEIVPLGYSVLLSLGAVAPSQGSITAANYAQLLSDGTLLTSVLVSLFYAAGSTALTFILGILFATMLTQLKRTRSLVESLMLLPVAVSPVVVGVVWSPSGVWDDANTFIHFILGLQYIDLTQAYIFLPVMALSEAWEWTPVVMLVLLGVVTSIPRESIEAASVHGASGFQIFRMIIIPAVVRSPVTQFVVALRFIDAMRAFEIPFAWSAWVGSPTAGGLTDTLSLYLFKLLVFPANGASLQYVSALAVILCAITVVSTTLLVRLLRGLGGVHSNAEAR